MENPNEQQMIELTWEWGYMNGVPGPQLAQACAQATNSGFAVFGVYPVPGKLVGSLSYDVLVCRQRPLNEQELAAREKAREAREQAERVRTTLVQP